MVAFTPGRGTAMKLYIFDFTQPEDGKRFEDYIQEWLADNKYAIVEAGGNVGEYFRYRIEEQQRQGVFLINGAQAEFASDMEHAVERTVARWKGTGFSTPR